jgi:hypothetical protein
MSASGRPNKGPSNRPNDRSVRRKRLTPKQVERRNAQVIKKKDAARRKRSDAMLGVVAKWLKSIGWNAVVIGVDGVAQSHKGPYHFELRFTFTGNNDAKLAELEKQGPA